MNFPLMMTPWQVYAIVGVVLMVAEIFVGGFVLLPIGLAFMLTALVSLFVVSTVAQLGLLAAFQFAAFWLFKRYLRRFQAPAGRLPMNAEGMIGAECIVVEEIRAGATGYVKLYGDTWQARYPAGAAVAKGQRVVITAVEGNKVVVELARS